MAQKPQNDGQKRLIGTVERFSFRNPESGFGVVRFRPDGSTTALCLVGQLSQLTEGQHVTVCGTESEHPRFGPQISVDSVEITTPRTAAGIAAYLSSGLVKGIGPTTAQRITDHFGEQTLDVIEHEPERLQEVRGLGRKRCTELVAAVHQQRNVQEVLVFLRSYGLGPALATRIVKHLGTNATALIQANPFRLAEEVIGVGFRTADRLAKNLGITPNAPERIRAGVLHCLTLASRAGHCFVPRAELRRQVATLLGLDEQVITTALEPLHAARQVVIEPTGDGETEHDRIFPRTLHLAEIGTTQLIDRLTVIHLPLPIDIEGAIEWFHGQSGLELPSGQLAAVRQALSHPVSVITGGPGVGKTTIIRALVEIFGANQLQLQLAAPTGRAAKRLEESTAQPASTIHRLLEFQPGIGRFVRDESNPLEGDMLVVDEASMIDIQLAYNLLRAVPPGMKLVLVGDVDQLPAVGPGNVLGDIIESGRVAVTELTEIFRQKRESRIVAAAYSILAGEVPTSGDRESDFFVVETDDGHRARELIAEIVTHRIPGAFGLDPLRDVQVLCPMYRGEAGADAINQALQQLLNPDRREVERGGRVFREGDKVMQIRNDYDLDLFNGDTGRVQHVDLSGNRLSIEYGERVIDYSFSDLDQLVPAYAISVHRSQGSEYPAVVIPLLTEHYVMLRRNLLYTAITRGKQLVVLVASRRALELAVGNCDETQRHTNLAERLGSQSQ